MKIQIILSATVTLLMAASLHSCKKSSTSSITPTPTPTTSSFTFKLDGGSAITIDSANAVLYTLSGGARYMDVYVYKGGSELLEFHFIPKTGSQTAGNVLGGTLLTYFESPVSSYDSQSGILNITTCDTVGNKIVGDFNFVGKVYPYTGATTHTITEGHMVVSKLTRQ